MMEATFESFKRSIASQEILDCLSFIGNDKEVDVFENAARLCAIVVPQIATADLLLVTRFLYHCLAWGDKSLASPTYAVAAHIAAHAREKEPILAALAPLTEIVAHDESESRRSYRALYMGICAGPRPGPRDDDRWAWPELVMFERIVAVKIPHLYEVNVADIPNISLVDMSSFPPLLPWDAVLLQGERFKGFFDVLSQYRFEPFMRWYEVTAKLLASLVGRDDLADLRRTIAIGELKIRSVFRATLERIEVTPQKEIDEGEPIEEEEEEIHEEQPAADPYAFAFLPAQTFVPDVAEINVIGNEQFEDGGNN
jgi:hypothetical protein